MKREDAFEVIRVEREYQDTVWPRDERRKRMYAFSAPHILLLEGYIQKLRDGWVSSGMNETERQRTIAKIAAMAVRALEEIEAPDVDLLKIGLR